MIDACDQPEQIRTHRDDFYTISGGQGIKKEHQREKKGKSCPSRHQAGSVSNLTVQHNMTGVE